MDENETNFMFEHFKHDKTIVKILSSLDDYLLNL